MGGGEWECGKRAYMGSQTNKEQSIYWPQHLQKPVVSDKVIVFGKPWAHSLSPQCLWYCNLPRVHQTTIIWAMWTTLN